MREIRAKSVNIGVVNAGQCGTQKGGQPMQITLTSILLPKRGCMAIELEELETDESCATLKAPFPWFGGKSRVAPMVWERFGDVANYVEPFFGSGAVLLGRPTPPRIETVNDLDGFVANFWRAVAADPEGVAHYADWPVNENDMHARHIWLVNERESLQARLDGAHDFYDARIAGWWAWGLCCWIGSGWCSGNGPWQSVEGKFVHLGDAGQGVNRQRVHLGDAGRGQGVHKDSGGLVAWMQSLAQRLRHVRVCSGDWSRVCGPTVTFKHGLTGVFLDPPYSAEAGRTDALYRMDDLSVAHDVRRWAIANGDNPLMRIALCGYDTEHAMPENWTAVQWKTSGGYGSQGSQGSLNAVREVIWFSPHCLTPTSHMNGHVGTLFDWSEP
jgi:DNA adenine methylase